MFPKTTQANTPDTGANYTHEQGKIVWCLKNQLLIYSNVKLLYFYIIFFLLVLSKCRFASVTLYACNKSPFLL